MRARMRAVACGVGLFVLWAGLIMAVGGLISDATRPPDTTASAGTAVAVVGVALIAGGYLLELLAFPTVTALGGLAAAMVALVGADALWVTAAILGHASPDGFDAGHAADDARLGALLCVLVAAGCLAGWLVWSRRRGAGVRVRHALAVTAIGLGTLLFMSGLVSAVEAIVYMARAGSVTGNTLFAATAAAGQAILSGVPGGVLLWHGAAILTGAPSRRFRAPSPWLPFAAAATAIALGALMLQTGTAYALMPLMHAVAIIAPGAAIVALAVWAGRASPSLQRTTWRELLLLGAYGAAIAASIAAIVNTAALYSTFLLRLSANGAFDGITNFGDFQNAVNNAQDYLGKGQLIALLLIVVAVIAPLNEEFWKGFGVRLLRGARPTRYQAFLFGLVSGVGFGVAEAQEYGLGAFSQSPYHWWDTVLLRGGSSSLHALASGIVGLAWFYLFQGKRLRALGLYLTAVGMHGSWNALNTLASARVLPGFRSLSDRALGVALEVVVGLIAVGIIVIICRLSAALGAEDPLPAKPPAAPPLEPLEPTGHGSEGDATLLPA